MHQVTVEVLLMSTRSNAALNLRGNKTGFVGARQTMPTTIDTTLMEAIRASAHPLTGTAQDYVPLLDLVGDARFTLLGEASHGTHEFYHERAQITKRLIEEKGFTAVAVEADWPDAYRVNRYVRGVSDDADAVAALADFRRFPSWMWRNTDVVEFVEWLRVYNDALPAGLLIDLLTSEEEAIDLLTAHLRFDIRLLAERLVGATDWLTQHPHTCDLRVGYFGASTGASAALVAAAECPQAVSTVVSRGGPPDLAGPALARVQAPTLLIVGGDDLPVIELNEAALAQLRCAKRLVIVPVATHLFEELGALDEVARLAREWFERHLMAAQ
jgi:putative phosphoribosyl transferase